MIRKRLVLPFVAALLCSCFAFGQNPVANFSANVTSGCAPLTVRFTDQSTGNPTSWNWEMSNGSLSNQQNPSVTFSTPGVYSVRLVVRNAAGIAERERVDYITVTPSPTVNFSSNIRLGCVPSVVQFTDLSTIPDGHTITEWLWNFGDGATSTQRNPTHTYNNVGYYSVSLTVASSSGCRRTVTRNSYIRIVGAVTTNFSHSQPSTCLAPFTVNFRDQSSGPGTITHQWDFGNGQTSTLRNPSTIYNAPGTYTVVLNTRSSLGCTGRIERQITINATTTDFTAPTSACLNIPVNFQNNSSAPPLFSSWDFGDGTVSGQINPSKTFLVPGTYNVKLVNRYANCTDSIIKPITILSRPPVDIMANDSTFCQAPATVQFTALAPGSTSWQWDFGDGNTSTQQNPQHQYSATGEYTVRLTVTTAAGCTNTVTRPAFIRVQRPTIRINTPATGCIPFSYAPRAIITTLDTIATYTWDMGDGTVLTGPTPPAHLYATEGVFPITLTITTVSGCTETVTIPNGVRTGTPPVPDFTFAPANACASEVIAFTDNSTTTPDAHVEWLWNFGDGGRSTQRNPRHIFTDTGYIDVTLTVINNGCERSTTRTVYVRPPVAGFTLALNCLTKEVTFTDTSLVNVNLPVSYSWNFGNGTTSALQNPGPIAYTPGSYTVTLTVTNGSCSYTRERNIIIADEPANFEISKNPACRNENFTLRAINSNPDNIVNYTWIIGGVTHPSHERSITHRLTSNGMYDVTLIVTDINGCATTQTLTNYITVNGPVALFEPATPGACLNKTVTFTDLSTPANEINRWTFDFGDGQQQTFTSAPFTHTYAQTGNYTVSLTVTDIAGCSDSYTLPTSLLVTDPKAGFRADTFYCPLSPLQFSDTSSGAGLTYFWDFGDGNTSTLTNPTNAYPDGNAEYTVKLVVTDIVGCSDSTIKNEYISIRSPQAAFTIQDTSTLCPPLRTTFTFNGSNHSSFLWSFGDGGESTLENPTYFYGNIGTFTPKLYVYGNGGCVDSAQSSVTVHNPDDIRINYTLPTIACNSLTVDFTIDIPDEFRFVFFFGDGSADSSRSKSLSHFYARPGFHTPYLVVYDPISGCQLTINGRQRIEVLGAVPLFALSRDELCDNGDVTFTDFTTRNEPIISTVWNFGDGNTSTVQSPTHTYTQPGLYTVTLNVTTQHNCSSSFSDTVLVYRTPHPVISGRDTLCVNVPGNYFGSTLVADTLTTWQWNFGNGQSTTQQNGETVYNTSGDYTIRLTTRNRIGCSHDTTLLVHVPPLPTVTPVVDPITIISGGNADLVMNYTGNIATYTWTPQYRLSCFDCATPNANPPTTTKYRVQLLDRFGCTNEGEVTVRVICNGQNFTIPNTFSPNGDGRNDVFYPKGTGLTRIKSLSIFNRWGQIVFEKREFGVNDPSSGWNGTFKGQPASADVYIYQMEIICENGEVMPVKGNVTLLR